MTSSEEVSTSSTLDDIATLKQIRKDHHVKGFKNPAEAAVALSLAAIKKSKTEWYRLVILSIMSGCMYNFPLSKSYFIKSHIFLKFLLELEVYLVLLLEVVFNLKYIYKLQIQQLFLLIYKLKYLYWVK